MNRLTICFVEFQMKIINILLTSIFCTTKQFNAKGTGKMIFPSYICRTNSTKIRRRNDVLKTPDSIVINWCQMREKQTHFLKEATILVYECYMMLSSMEITHIIPVIIGATAQLDKKQPQVEIAFQMKAFNVL